MCTVGLPAYSRVIKHGSSILPGQQMWQVPSIQCSWPHLYTVSVFVVCLSGVAYTWWFCGQWLCVCNLWITPLVCWGLPESEYILLLTDARKLKIIDKLTLSKTQQSWTWCLLHRDILVCCVFHCVAVIWVCVENESWHKTCWNVLFSTLVGFLWSSCFPFMLTPPPNTHCGLPKLSIIQCHAHTW